MKELVRVPLYPQVSYVIGLGRFTCMIARPSLASRSQKVQPGIALNCAKSRGVPSEALSLLLPKKVVVRTYFGACCVLHLELEGNIPACWTILQRPSILCPRLIHVLLCLATLETLEIVCGGDLREVFPCDKRRRKL